MLDFSVSPSWVFAALAISYYVYEVLAVRAAHSKRWPTIGRPSSLLPISLLNLNFAFNSCNLLEQGYKKFRDQTWQLIRGDGQVVLLPVDKLIELSSIPASIASPHEALEHDLLGPYTGLNLILDTRLHSTIVQRKLTPKLGLLTPDLQEEMEIAFEDYWPSCNDWTKIKPFQILAKVSARLSAKAIIGDDLCRDPLWLHIAVNYSEDLFRTIIILRLFPRWAQPFMCYFLPSYWRVNTYMRQARDLLAPKIDRLLKLHDAGQWKPTSKDDFNVLSWLADASKGNDRNAQTLAQVEVILALASVHTVLVRMVNMIYDLTVNPESMVAIRAELENKTQEFPPLATHDGRHAVREKAFFDNLDVLDSVLRESQRLSPPSILGLKRLFKEAYTFEDGTHIPRDTYVAMPIYAIENDPDHTPDPTQFDGLRSYRLRQRKAEHDEHMFASLEQHCLNFGYGKSACPGRWFASLVLKMVVAKLTSQYDFRLVGQDALSKEMPNGSTGGCSTGIGNDKLKEMRPRSVFLHEFQFPWPWDTIMVKTREG